MQENLKENLKGNLKGLTPSQTVGPFFKYGLTPNGKYDWNDAFTNNLVTPDTSGERVRVEGRVFDGDGAPVGRAEQILKDYVALLEAGTKLSGEDINSFLKILVSDGTATLKTLTESGRNRNFGKKRINPKTPNQRAYLDMIERNDLVFGIGPAGTGKTYLAVAMAVSALLNKQVTRIILTRPAVEAGEKLGFLPGDLSQKVDPYLRPLYDALYEMLGFEKVAKLIERNVIEIAPLAYMRGRTLNDSYVILDEAQNTTVEQMKMFLTRIGFGTVAVITGDVTQVDLPRNTRSGLRQAVEVLRDVSGISFTFFTSRDVVRHPLVAKIVRAYEAFEQKEEDAP